MSERTYNSMSVEPSYDGVILQIYLRPEDGKGSWIEFETFGQAVNILRILAWAIVRRYLFRERPHIKGLATS